MNERQTLIMHSLMIVCLAALLLLVVKNHRADIAMIHDRLDTQFMNGHVVPPPPPSPDASEAA